MKRTSRKIVTGMTFLSLVIPACSSFATGEEKLTSEAIMQQLEEMVQLNSEKMAKLKPEIDATSEKLRKMIHESVDKGFVRMEEFSKQFDEVSRETEVKVKEFLTSEEYEKFKNVLTKIDKEALQETKNEIVQDMNDLLELSEEQMNELKPVLEDSVNKMNEMLDTFAKDGADSWAEVASKYDEMSKELKEKLQEILDGSQLEKLEKYKKEKRNKLKEELIEV
jgi:polyhydroxyalkanoate synthesis regulator phasin